MSNSFNRKSDLIFQITTYREGRKKTPIDTSIAKSIHDKCRSKKLIMVFNNLGLCISYDEIERIDYSLANRIIKVMQEYGVPVPPSKLIHGAMDNFGRIENSKYGKGSSHDTILMLFQNNHEVCEVNEMSIKSPDEPLNRSIDNILHCQKQLSFRMASTIPGHFVPSVFRIPLGVMNSSVYDDVLWRLSRHTIPLYST